MATCLVAPDFSGQPFESSRGQVRDVRQDIELEEGDRRAVIAGRHLTANGGPISDATKDCVTNNQLLNTLNGAFGIQKPGGAPVDDFGDASLPKGVLTPLTS